MVAKACTTLAVIGLTIQMMREMVVGHTDDCKWIASMTLAMMILAVLVDIRDEIINHEDRDAQRKARRP